MAACPLCGNALGDGRFLHDVCRGEFERRSGCGRCVKCGGADSAPGSNWCGVCVEAGQPEYLGYPPGGA